MSLGKRIWMVVAISSIAWLLPAQVFSVERDQYAFKSLVGQLHFEYERYSTEQGGFESTSNRFLQKYTLDFKGYVLNRRLIIYDAGYSYSNNDYRSDTVDVNTGVSNYYLSTTILPLSAIPLTLYGSRLSTRTTTSGDSTTTRKIYGLKWKLYFRTLPKTSLLAERDTTTQSDGSTFTTDIYALDLEKVIGPTKNNLSYYLTNTRTSTPGNDASLYVLNFSNNTKISRSTDFFFGATRSDSDATADVTAKSTGLSLLLHSTPSRDFSQSHSYNYYKTESDTNTQSGSSYLGDMRYNFTPRLDANLSLYVDNKKDDSATFTSETLSVSTNLGISYRITNALSLSQTVAYSNIEYNSDDPAANVDDIKRFSTLTSINYSKRFNWAALRTSAGIGYLDERAESSLSGQAIDHRYSVTLSKIDLNRYVGATTSLKYSTRTIISGKDIHRSSYGYNLHVYNKLWKNYVVSNAKYSKSGQTSYRRDLDRQREVYRLDAKSTYFKRTTFSVFAQRSNAFNELTGPEKRTGMGFSAGYRRNIYRGQLSLLYSFKTVDSTYEGGSDTIDQTTYSVQYARLLISNMQWRFVAQRAVQEASNTSTSTTSVKNSIHYPFRSWLLTGDHEYRILAYTNTERTESILTFRATRYFYRIW